MEEFNLVQKIAIWALPIIFGVTIHEAAHGYMAHKLGDDTAYLMGRITLNPIKHIDPIGTVVLPLLLMATTGFVFGWAKPVPVNMNRLRKPRRDMAIVGLAGPFSNLLMAIIWMALLKLTILFLPHNELMVRGVIAMCWAGVTINIVLMVLNLIPIPPLDGSRFLSYLLPAKLDEYFNRLTPFGIIIILALIATGILSTFMMPAIGFFQNLFRIVFQV